jgi:hypothetical protein
MAILRAALDLTALKRDIHAYPEPSSDHRQVGRNALPDVGDTPRITNDVE